MFALLLAGRLLIAGTGYLEDQDEFLYLWIHLHFADFIHLSTWQQCVFDMQGQPPEIAVRLLQYISLLPVAAFSGKQMLHPDILYFIGLYNILTSLLILYVFFRILLKLQFNFELAITGVVLLGTLFNFNIYTRHILPYDQALLFQLLAFRLLLDDDVRSRTIFFAGLLSAIGFTNYLGCFMFVFINGGYLLLTNYKTSKIALTKSLLFALPFILLVLSYEVVARIYGGSYLYFLTDYYGTVYSEGSSDEGFHYVFLYFHLVEKWWGMFLLLLFFAGSYLLFKKSDSVKIKQVLVLGIVAYLTYGGYVFFFQKMVFEGRVLHIYYPFIVIGVLGFLQQQKLWRVNYFSLATVVFAFVNYGFVIKDFNGIGYPRNAIYKYHLFEDKLNVNFVYHEELSPSIQYSDRAVWYIDSSGLDLLPPGQYVLRNICFLPHFPDSVFKTYEPWHKTEKDSVIFEQLHFQSHPAYALEYCTRYGRDFYLEKRLKISVIKIHAP